ncbi:MULTISPECIES: rod shape-determining protein MreD [Acinetobacter]|jgi:rod shape-determining protein MreD|uniref:Rod shape-determining protein MreD n=1 Tax=Acinetobacter courvalinii TaxID=280147 RepID=A0AA42IAF4_9GAMM|nr:MULTISPECIES: rod shape-determining protein MreD [Acinetobacter]EXB46492.1 rod shape-determining protein MreD [Acinetobacter baumannii 146457]ENX09947.1 rod shape-determining protein MreD [Acinetobacter courvalinii]EYT15266.1 rod shape-determining protein MreD [Acinetobacter sp. 1000160]MBJ9957321.1 rod shape-determining protein MreD [Acinetobacter courvalinii]MCU4369482.1 rod shape-determining protein MreD [Acinetobacter courvalinii]
MPIAKLNYEKRKDPLLMIILSIVIGSVLMIYPIPYEASGWRPSMMLMIMLFWILYQPVWCGVWFAFGMGLFVDLLLDAPFGLNALSFVLIAFTTRYLIRERRILTFGNSWVIAVLAIVAHITFLWISQTIAGTHFSIARHWQPVVTGVLAWPLVYYCLHKWRI